MTAAHDYSDLHELIDRLEPEQADELREHALRLARPRSGRFRILKPLMVLAQTWMPRRVGSCGPSSGPMMLVVDAAARRLLPGAQACWHSLTRREAAAVPDGKLMQRAGQPGSYETYIGRNFDLHEPLEASAATCAVAEARDRRASAMRPRAQRLEFITDGSRGGDQD